MLTLLQWSLFMGIEHERVHIETSSVLIRQLPVAMVTTPSRWNYAPIGPGLMLIINERINEWIRMRWMNE